MSLPLDLRTQGPLAFGLRRLMATHPFYAAFMDRWRIIEDARLPTLGVRLARDLRIELLYNKAFVTRITPDELGSVLLHEVHHVLFRHLGMSTAAFPDHEALVVAQEVTCNEFVPGPLPGGGVRLEDFALPPHESTTCRYERLRRTLAASDRAAAASRTVDSHDGWAASEESAGVDVATLGTVLAADVQDALAALPEEDRQRAAEELHQKLAPHIGRDAGLDAFALTGGGVPRTDWASVLRAFVWRLRRPAPSLHRPPRRLPELTGVVPGRTMQPHRPTVLAVLDTSGSMIDAAILRTLRTEIHALHALAEILVAECDARVHRVYRYSGVIAEVIGGGGTSFAEPLASSFLAKHRVDAVLYFTDGQGTAPSRRPSIPVVWCLLGPWAQRPAPWGKAFWIDVA